MKRALLAALLLALVPVAAGTQVILSGGSPGGGHVAIRYAIEEGGSATARVGLCGASMAARAENLLFDSDRVLEGRGLSGTGIRGGASAGARIAPVSAEAGPVAHDDRNCTGDPGRGPMSRPGEHTVVLYAVGDEGSWSWVFEGTGVTVLGVTSGPAFLYLLRDFPTGAHADAWVSGSGATVGAGATSLSVRGNLVGAFTPVAGGAVLGPGGERACSCVFADTTEQGGPVTDWGAGEYRFAFAGATPGLDLFQPVLSGADIAWP